MKKMKKKKKHYSEKNSTKFSWPMSAKSDKIFLFKKNNNSKQKLHSPVSAKSDT